jgi:hypothetical protein
VGVMPRFPDTSASCYGRPSPGASVPVTGNLGVHGLFGRSPVISVLTATKESATEPELPIRIDAHLGLNRRQPRSILGSVPRRRGSTQLRCADPRDHPRRRGRLLADRMLPPVVLLRITRITSDRRRGRRRLPDANIGWTAGTFAVVAWSGAARAIRRARRTRAGLSGTPPHARSHREVAWSLLSVVDGVPSLDADGSGLPADVRVREHFEHLRSET